MNFYVSEQHKRSGKRKTVLAALLVAGIIVGAIWMFIASESLYHKILSLIIALLLAKHLPSAYKNIKIMIHRIQP
jgi:MFS-type transporter involved in bile tolerance (Atg22 family)